LTAGLALEEVELSITDPAKEGFPLRPRVHDHHTIREVTVAYGNPPAAVQHRPSFPRCQRFWWRYARPPAVPPQVGYGSEPPGRQTRPVCPSLSVVAPTAVPAGCLVIRFIGFRP